MRKIIEITDLKMPELEIYTRYTENQLRTWYEPKGGIFIAESPKVVERALDAGIQPISFLMENKHVEGEAKELLARCPDIPVYTAEPEVLAGLTGFPLTRGMLAAMVRPKIPSIEEICRNARRIAVLANIENPTNAGAVFRSAAALGIDGVIFTGDCTDPLYRRSIRVSMGTVFQLPWTILKGKKAEDLIELLHANGFSTAALALTQDSISIDDPVLKQEEKLAIILGNEGDGLPEPVIRDSDYTVLIPMFHGVDSLNAAAAAAIAFWELR